MDLGNLKGRIADSLVEDILRQAGYRVALVGRESHVQQPVKTGSDEFMPDFLAWRQAPRFGEDWPLHRLFAIEVKYRAKLGEYLQRDGHSDFSRAAEKWPNLYFILVTDNPDPGRSCFQALDLRHYSPNMPPVPKDLYEVTDLDIDRATVEQYERLAREIFRPLATLQTDPPGHKPPAKTVGRASLVRDAGSSSYPKTKDL